MRLVPTVTLLIATVLATLSPGLSSGAAHAQSVGSSESGPILLNQSTFIWIKDVDHWLNVNWTSRGDVSDVTISADSAEPGVVVRYPDETLPYTQLLTDDVLLSHEIDSSQFALEIGPQTGDNFDLVITMDFTIDGAASSEEFTISIEVVELVDGSTTLQTSAISIPALAGARDGWVDLTYFNPGATELFKFRSTVTGDVTIEHPQGAFTGLHHDERLSEGERDVARVWIDPLQLSAGSQHILTVVTQYQLRDSDEWVEETSTVVLTVE